MVTRKTSTRALQQNTVRETHNEKNVYKSITAKNGKRNTHAKSQKLVFNSIKDNLHLKSARMCAVI